MFSQSGKSWVLYRFSLRTYSGPSFSVRVRVATFRTAVSFWGHTTWNLTGLSLKRDCGSERVKSSYLHTYRQVRTWYDFFFFGVCDYCASGCIMCSLLTYIIEDTDGSKPALPRVKVWPQLCRGNSIRAEQAVPRLLLSTCGGRDKHIPVYMFNLLLHLA